jgi:hypothetical protein
MKTNTFVFLMLAMVNLDILALAFLPLSFTEALATLTVCIGTLILTAKTLFPA